MRKLLIIAAILVCATGFGQSSPDIVLKVIPGSLTAQYQQQVEYKAYLYNRSKEPVKIVNPNFSEPAWKFYKDEWLVLDANGKNVNTLGGYCGVASPFQDKDITTILRNSRRYFVLPASAT